ncbi:MAG TPA: flagellar basal body rod protein FlgB [Devosiaceae bacterium]
MGIGDMPLLAALRDKMHWHQARQMLLAENVANADTPGYRGRDLKPFEPAEQVGQRLAMQVSAGASNPMYIPLGGGTSPEFAVQQGTGFEVTPEGNDVNLEDEMMKVASNQMDYQAVTTLYSRSLQMIRTAIGRSA